MGCTSSIPTQSAHRSSTERNITFSDEKHEQLEENTKIAESIGGEMTKGTKVLQECDNLDTAIDLVRKQRPPLTKMPSIDLDKDLKISTDKLKNISYNKILYDNKNSKEDFNIEEDKLSTMEEVVEKVVEVYIDNGHLKPDNIVMEPNKTEEGNTKCDTRVKEEKDDTDKHEVKGDGQLVDQESGEMEEEPEEAQSPSQSVSSRATRWEALADVAAELPPSLAVDPITGQIYALSK